MFLLKILMMNLSAEIEKFKMLLYAQINDNL